MKINKKNKMIILWLGQEEVKWKKLKKLQIKVGIKVKVKSNNTVEAEVHLVIKMM